jgi:hypothetical protein
MRTNRLLFAVPIFAFGMASCSNDDSPVNPGQAEVVKTQFTIALNDKNVHTRQSTEIVQGQTTPVFRGMENIVLTPFATEISGGATRLGENIVLGTTGAIPGISTANTITSLNGGSKSQLYKDVAIPLGTKHFLFYGVAPKATDTGQKVNGNLSPSGLTGNNPSGINFNLEPICSYTDEEIKSNAKVVGLTEFLNQIVSANYNNSGTSVNWKDLDASDPLKSLFTEFTTMHAGASSNILALVQDLYDALNGNTTPMAEAIRTAIQGAAFNGSKKCVSISGSTLTLHSDLQGWPGNVNLPDGSVYVAYESSSNSFSIVPANNNLGMNTPKIQDYTYPASLYYRANTPIKVHNASLSTDYENNSLDWNALLGKYTEGSAVGLATRSIALVNPINYAVARLDVKVKAKENQATLKDKIGNDVPVEGNFPVTGVLIGGQKQVDWEFKPVGGAVEKTIYDSQLANPSFTLSSSTDYPAAFNHTLVLETAPDADIHVALEFQNNSGKAFRGNNGDLIPNGCKFYLVGLLKVDGAEKKVFEQDKITTARFNITSLKGAYNVVPDLRLPALELGLSVNLEWSVGGSFDVNIE